MGKFVKINDAPEREVGNLSTGKTPGWVVSQGSKGRLVRINAEPERKMGDLNTVRKQRAGVVTERDFQRHAGLRRDYGTYENYLDNVKTYDGFTTEELNDDKLGALLEERAKTNLQRTAETPDEKTAAWQEQENDNLYDKDSDAYKRYDAWQKQRNIYKNYVQDKVSEGEFNRSSFMQMLYGSYQNYLAGVKDPQFKDEQLLDDKFKEFVNEMGEFDWSGPVRTAKEATGTLAPEWREIADAYNQKRFELKQKLEIEGYEKIKDDPNYSSYVYMGEYLPGAITPGGDYEKLLKKYEELTSNTEVGGMTPEQRYLYDWEVQDTIKRLEYSSWTKEEADTYNAYIAMENLGIAEKGTAEGYAEALKRVHNARDEENITEAAREDAKNDPFTSMIVQDAAMLGATVAPFAGFYQELKNEFTGEYEPIDTGSNWWTATAIKKASGEGFAENGWLAQQIQSINENGLRNLLFGEMGLGVMFLSAAGQSMYENAKSGMTTREAVEKGLMEGLEEYLTEKISFESLEKLVSLRRWSDVGELAKLFGQQVLSEGGEEMINELMNVGSDLLIRGSGSDFVTTLEDYRKAGYDEGDATRKTVMEYFVKQPLIAGAGGAISGAFFGLTGITGAWDGIQDSKLVFTEADIFTDGKFDMAKLDKRRSELTSEARSEAGAKFVMDQYEAIVNWAEQQAVKQAVQEEAESRKQRTEAESAIVADLRETGLSDKEAKKLVGILKKTAGGDMLTSKELRTLAASREGMAELAKLTGVEIPSGATASQLRGIVQSINENARKARTEGESAAEFLSPQSAAPLDQQGDPMGERNEGGTRAEGESTTENEVPAPAIPQEAMTVNGVMAPRPGEEIILPGGANNGEQTQDIQRNGNGEEAAVAGEDTVYGGDAGGGSSYADAGRSESVRPPAGVKGATRENRALTFQRQKAVTDQPYISPASLGIDGGGEEATMRILPQDDWDDELRGLNSWLDTKGIREVHMVVGTITVDNGGGPVDVLDVIKKDTGELFLRVDSLSRSATETGVHAAGHYMADEEKITRFMNAVKNRKSAVWEPMYEKYMQKWAQVTNYYEGMTEAEKELYIWEEILGDAYANINNMGTRASAFHDIAEAVLEGTGEPQTGSEVSLAEGENAAAAAGIRGPPRYMTAGESGKNADLNALATAKAMKQEGASEESILTLTGWYQGADGKWRWEIDDSGMEYRRDGDARLLEEPKYQRLQELTQKWADSFEKDGAALTESEEAELERLQEEYKDRVWDEKYLLRDFLKHDKLFETYPYLNRVSLVFDDLSSGENGYFDKNSNTIVLSNDLVGVPERTLLHEVQHVIQKIEGFSGGSSPEYWAQREYESGNFVTERLQGEYDKLLNSLSREEQNRYIRYTELERELERLSLSDENSEDGRRYAKLEAEQDAIYEELYPNQWFRDLLDLNRRMNDAPGEYMKMYRNTAGEIEARETANRWKMTAEERRNSLPYRGDENTVFADGGEGYAMSWSEQDSVKEQLREHQDELNNMKAVATIRDNGWRGMSTGEFRQKIVNDLKKTGYRVDNPSLGVIDFDEKLLNRSLNYIQTDAEAAAYQALPQVLKRGIEISGHDNHKGRDYETLTIAAPVELNGKRGNMAVVVMKTKGNRYKVHRILTPEGTAFALPEMTNAELNTVGAFTNGSQSLGGSAPAISSASDASVAEGETGVKSERDALKGYFDENGRFVLPRAAEEDAADEAPKRTTNRYAVDDEQDAAEKKKKKEVKPVAKSRPIIAKKELRQNMMNIFSIPAGSKNMLGDMVDQVADKLLETGTLSWEERKEFFDKMYDSGVMTVAADEYSRDARDVVLKRKIYVPESVKHEFGGSEDYNEFRKTAFAAGVYLTNNKSDEHIDTLNMELAERLPGLFDAKDLDMTEILKTVVQVAEEGKGEKMSLAEYTAELAGREYVSEDEVLDNLERQVDWALRTFAEKAKLEVTLRDRTGVKLAQQREAFGEMQNRQREREQTQRLKERDARKEQLRRQRENRELRELQQKTLKNLQWLKKNRNKAPAGLLTTWDEVLGDIDIYAVGAANEMRWSEKYQATWKDLAQMYKDAQNNDPNFLPSKELERIVARVDYKKIADMDIDALNDLYKAAVGLRTEFYNRNRILGENLNAAVDEVYQRSKGELEFGAGGKAGAATRNGNLLDKFVNMEQLSPMNVMERMAGWNPESSFYSMAKQLEKGEKDIRAYTVKAQKQLKDFLTENADWVKTADGQGKDGVWYELEVPELLELGHGDAPIFGDSVKVYMTPSQKVHMYLESKNYDNLLHMAGGRTFPNKELYSQGKRREAFAQGKTIRLAPETVKSIVSDLTAEEQALANVLEKYYNDFAAGEINRVSNILYGYDKAMSSVYAPIYSNSNYTKSEIGVYEATAEGVGNLKERKYSKNPSYNIGAFDAFERHVEQTARFVGMAIPARNWQTLLNWREESNSMKDVISHTWGDASLNYISDLIQTLQGGKGLTSDSVSTFTDKLFSNYISAVFGANPSIVFKQLGSIPLASAYLGLENFPSPGQVRRVDREFIGKYTQELDWRTLGYATPETKMLKENPNWSQSNKAVQFVFGGGAITAMDGWAASVLWPWAENTARREFPDLEVGTQEEIDNGTSPFYKKVAELFDEAVARSQSTSDEMHQGALRKSKNPVTRAFTMFKSDSSQTYNALRQRLGEAKYYKSQGNEAKSKKSKKLLGAAVIAAIGGYGFAELIEFLMNLWKHKGKRYRDEDGELTAESVTKEMALGLVGDLAGIMSGGEELAEIIGNIITGDTWYGMDTPGLEQLTDVIETIMNEGKAGAEWAKGAANVVKNGGNLPEYFRRHGNDLAGSIKELAMAAATYLPGLPVNNLEAYMLGAVKWIAPSVATAYEDAFATAKKSNLKGLTGAALEQRVGDILSTRGVKTEDEVRAALAELYEAGFTDAVPVNTPGKVSVNGEDRELNAYQQQTYDTVWSGTISGALEELIGSADYQNADNETRAKMIDSLYDYAGEQARGVVFGDYEKESFAGHAEDIIGAGASTADWAIWRGKTAGMKDAEKYALLREEDYPDKVKAAIAGSLMGTEMETESGNPTAYAKMLKALDAGLSMDGYLELREEDAVDRYLDAVEDGVKSDTARNMALELAGLEPQEGKKSISDAQKWRAAIDAGETQDEQKAALKAIMSESAIEKYEIADSYGISPLSYVRLKEILPGYDADGNGSYSQAEITAAIDSLGGASGGIVLPGGDGDQKLTLIQQAVLWQLYTGSKSAKNNPYSTSIGQQVIDERSGGTNTESLVLPG